MTGESTKQARMSRLRSELAAARAEREARAQDDEPPRDDGALPRGRGERVLVVDDDPRLRTLLRRTLERFGYQVEVAAHGSEALSAVTRPGARFDLVFTDLAMPVMDGVALVGALRELAPELRIVCASGRDAERMLGAGSHHLVPKPYTPRAVLRALRHVLDPAG